MMNSLPLREYRYSAAELGLAQFPPGELRLEGTTLVTDPNDADIFVCPCSMFTFHVDSQNLDPHLFRRFKHFEGKESRHVLFDVSDWTTVFNGIPAIMLRCNLKQSMLDVDRNSIPLSWPIENYEDVVGMPPSGFLYDVGCQAWASTDTRKLSAQACLSNATLKCDISMYSDFTGYCWDTEEGLRRRREFRRSMRESRVQLCAESIPSVLPYRFFEALSAARVPVLIGSDYVLPFQDEIDYDSCILRCSRDEASGVDRLIQQFIQEHSDNEIVAMGKRGRAYYERWMNRDLWPKTHAYLVKKKLKELRLWDGEIPAL